MWPYADAETVALLTWLDTEIYAGLLKRPAHPLHLDLLGVGRWIHDYIRHRDAGRSEDEARALIEQEIRRIVGLPAPDPAPAPTPHPQPTGDPRALRGDFLTMQDRYYTHILPGWKQRIPAAVALMQARAYTDVSLYVANEGDYKDDLIRFDYYTEPAAYRHILATFRAAGLRPVVWLCPDDAKTWHQAHPPARLRDELWPRFLPQVDDLVSCYVAGLEMDEYWGEKDQEANVRALARVTRKPVLVHYRAGKWSTLGDGCLYQYTDDEVADDAAFIARTRTLAQRLTASGKVLVAGEFGFVGEARARTLGRLAVAHGATGSAQGI